MSLPPTSYPPSSIPSNPSPALSLVSANRDWWTFRQLRALQKNWTGGQLYHSPYYRPAVTPEGESPSTTQVGTEHYFEWRIRNTTTVILSFHIIIHPSFSFF